MELNKHTEQSSIVCVDLDGTLIQTDMLWESLCALLKKNPFKLLFCPVWLLRGRAFLKQKLALEIQLNPASLPYNNELIELLGQERKQGKRLILATASDEQLAQRISDHLGIFDEVLASDGSRNLSGVRKLEVIRKNYGQVKFDYAGDRAVDIALWEECEQPIIVSNSRAFIEKMCHKFPDAKVIMGNEAGLGDILRLMRVHQWVKNLLIFVPILMAHKISEPLRLWDTFSAFLAFCFCASAVYVLNDILDLEADRQHVSKRNRALASGRIKLISGLTFIPILLILACLLAVNLTHDFLAILAFYFALTFCYSLFLKTIPILDIVVLASLYSTRIMAGAAAAHVSVSEWLIAFSMFIFLSLAAVKRFSEILSLRRENKSLAAGRGYMASDLEQIAQLGAASGYISVLVLALYVSSGAVQGLYAKPVYLWFICPVLFYWIGRIWLIAHRGQLDDDPVVFALRDKVSYIVGLVGIILMFLAT